MRTSVRLFASLRSRFGEETILEVELPAAVGDLEADLRERGIWTEGARIAVNHRFASSGDRVNQGDEIAVVPPVSGG
ncbi:MAG: MoaD/ThiS family protein [Armatimonadetes bacterium]|nr:MoaD/ThiS family protein [Armatimonadota bacterium]